MSVAIVTGASRGLGEALAVGLVRSGWSIVIDGRGADALQEVAARLERALAPGAVLMTVPGDITDAAHRAALVDAARSAGGLDLLINNAGILGPSPLPAVAEFPLPELRVVFEVNVVAPVALLQRVLPLLRRSPDPRIINITSDAAVEAYEGWGGYGAGKAALDHFGAVLAAEEPTIRVWSVDPGDLRTQMHQAAFPGEDISDRPEPTTVVPAFLDLIGSGRDSGRYKAGELVSSGASS